MYTVEQMVELLLKENRDIPMDVAPEATVKNWIDDFANHLIITVSVYEQVLGNVSEEYHKLQYLCTSFNYPKTDLLFAVTEAVRLLYMDTYL